MVCSWHSWIYSTPRRTPTFSWPLMSLRPARDMSLGRWLLVACFSSVKNHNVSGLHLFVSFTTRQRNPFATPRTVLQRSKKSFCNRSQFRTLLLAHRFIKIRPSHLRPVSSEFILFLWNIIFTFYYTRVRPQCYYSILLLFIWCLSILMLLSPVARLNLLRWKVSIPQTQIQKSEISRFFASNVK